MVVGRNVVGGFEGICVQVCGGGVGGWVSAAGRGEGKMQVWTSHYRVACVLSLIHCYWPCSHLSPFTLLILCLPHLTSLTRTHMHTRAHTRAHIQLSIQAGKSSVHYNIYTSQSFLCAQLRLGKIVLQNSAYTLFTLHSLCLFCSPFLCSTTLWTCAGRNLFYAPASLSVCSLTGSLWTGVFWTGRESHLKCLKFKLHTQIKPCQ